MAEHITTEDDRDRVAPGTVVRSSDGTIACRHGSGVGVIFGDERPFPWSILALPLTVLWAPSADTGPGGSQ